MKALVKAHAQPGLWIEDVPNLRGYQRRQNSSSGDRNLRNGSAYLRLGRMAQKTIPVPLVIGHEFVGEIVETARTSPTSRLATA